MTRTYVVVTAPNADYRVRDELARLGHDVWLPECVHRRKVRRGAVVSLKGPLFPGYLFVSLDAGMLGDVEAVRGVAGLLPVGRQPLPVSEESIAWLREAYAGARLLIFEGHKVWRQFTSGDVVRVEDGAFAGHEAVFDAKASERLSWIRLDIAGRSVRTKIPTEALVGLSA